MISINPLNWFKAVVPVATTVAPVATGLAGINSAQTAAIQAILGQVPVIGSVVAPSAPSATPVGSTTAANPLSQLAALQQTLIGLAAQITAVANQL